MVRCLTVTAGWSSTGLVERPLSLSLEELRRFEVRELVVTLQCAGNRRNELMAVRDIPGEIPWGPGAIGTAVVARGGARGRAAGRGGPGRRAAHRAAGDEYEVSIPRHKALAGEVLLAWEMNGAPLTPDHGAPLRVVVPGYIGARSVKWVTGVRALAEPSQGYYQAVAYRLDPGSIPLGAVAVNADILSPSPGAEVPAGALEIVGYAFAGDDRGSCAWTSPATAARRGAKRSCCADLGPWAWRRWRLLTDVAPGPLRPGRAGVGQRRRDPARGRGGDLESRRLRQQFLGAR